MTIIKGHVNVLGRAIVGLCGVATLGGCAAVDRVSDRGPFFTAPTARSRTQVAGCISNSWHRTFGFRTRTAQNEGQTQILLSTGNVIGVDMIATVYDNRVEVRKRDTSWGFLDGDLRQAASECL